MRVDAPVAWVRFNRPAAHNSVIPTMMIEIHAALTELARDDTLSVVVLTGAGRTFCPGADLTAALTDHNPDLPPVVVYQSATLLHEMPQLTIAAVNGGCAGAGFAWAAACDLRIATARARFSVAFPQLGLTSELGLPWTLSRALGGAAARDLCFLPAKLTADDARRIGLVARVFPDDRFEAEVDAIVTELGSRPRRAVRGMKANLLLAERSGLAEFVDAEARRHQSFFTGSARAESMRALQNQGLQLSQPETTEPRSQGLGKIVLGCDLLRGVLAPLCRPDALQSRPHTSAVSRLAQPASILGRSRLRFLFGVPESVRRARQTTIGGP